MGPVDARSNPDDLTTHKAAREQQAIEELAHTWYAAGVRTTLITVFLVTIVAVPVFEVISDIRTNVANREQLLSQGVAADDLPSRRPRAFRFLDILPSAPQLSSPQRLRGWNDFAPGRLREYENDLVINSAAVGLLRPWVQTVLTRWLDVGNEKVFAGRDRWLFYSDGLDYVTGPGFLDRSASEGLASERDEIASMYARMFPPSDPRTTIVQFHDALQQVGATLVLLPIPDKATISASFLSPRAAVHPAELHNRSWDEFVADMQRRGVALLDVTKDMMRREQNGEQMFRPHDSHWTPGAVDMTAQLLARYLAERTGLLPLDRADYSRSTRSYASVGDLVALLKLPPSQEQRLFPAEPVTVSEVSHSTGGLWQSDPTSDIWLIGDSFLEVYSTQAESRHAGLAEQLSFYLQRPVHRAASHMWGPYLAREALGQTLAQVRDAARGRKVVVWEFAVRNMTAYTWPLMR